MERVEGRDDTCQNSPPYFHPAAAPTYFSSFDTSMCAAHRSEQTLSHRYGGDHRGAKSMCYYHETKRAMS